MSNDMMNPAPDTENDLPAMETVTEKTADSSSPNTSEPAFIYQSPVVESPASVDVPGVPSVDEERTVAKAEEPVETAEKSAEVPDNPCTPVTQQPVQQAYQQPVQQTTPGVTQQFYQYTPVNPTMLVQQNTSDGFAVASLICAIVGLVSCCTVLPSFLALIFGAISKAKNDGTRPTGVSTAGLILGIVGIIINLLVLLGMFYME